MYRFCRQNNIRIKFGAPYSPFSNGLNERNHYSCDIVVNKAMSEDKKLTLQQAVDKAAWTHNTNKSRKGYLPLELATGKAVTFPGVEKKDKDEEVDEYRAIQRTLEQRHKLTEEFRRTEFEQKIKMAQETRVSSYKDEKYEKEDEVLFQEKDGKDWFGPGKVISYRPNEVEIRTENGIKRIHPHKVS